MIDYAHPLRRRVRSARRVGSAVVRPRTWREGTVVPAYWWDGHPNFGDDLTPWLLAARGMVPVHREPHDARVAGVGSVLEFLPEDFDGAIWGSGLMSDGVQRLPRATALAVRGALTRELLEARGKPVLGDPGLLVARHLKHRHVRWTAGFVPHGHHRSNSRFLSLIDPQQGHRLINVHQSARRAVREIAACEIVITSSLHGLVTADAFGIPAVWTALVPALNGGDFKFRDYESAVSPGRSRFSAFDETTTAAELIARAQPASADTVRDLSDGLELALGQVSDFLGSGARFPRGFRQIRPA